MTQTQILFDILQNNCLLAAVVFECCVVHVSADRCCGACMAPALMLCCAVPRSTFTRSSCTEWSA